MSTEALPTRALKSLAESIGLKDHRLIQDIKTRRVEGDKVVLTISIERTMSQGALERLVR